MPITPVDSIMYANQNSLVAATKQTDYQNRIQQQEYAAIARSAEKENKVVEVNELTEEQKIDSQRESEKEKE